MGNLQQWAFELTAPKGNQETLPVCLKSLYFGVDISHFTEIFGVGRTISKATYGAEKKAYNVIIVEWLFSWAFVLTVFTACQEKMKYG